VSWRSPNLASRPFVNQRPVRRLALLLALVAILLTAWNVVSWWRVGSGSATRQRELSRLEAETTAARSRLATIEQDLAARHLAAENLRAEFLNERIAQRTFGWNELFDRLAEVLPDGVRLRSLSPSLGSSRRRTTQPVATEGRRSVELGIRAEATDDESMLQFVDRLYAHPSFATPNLARESRERGGRIAFDLTVTFFPGGDS